MILILTEKFDIPTENVISKLETENANFKVIYGSDFLEIPFLINLNKNFIFTNNEKIENINIVWYRRWISKLFRFSENPKEDEYLRREFEEFSSNFMLNLPVKKWLNTPPYINSFPSKSHQLKKAKDLGLCIPTTIITNHLQFLKAFYKKNEKNIITKNLSDPYFYSEEDQNFATYTTLVNQQEIEKQETLFFPSLFQNNIDKIIEIRIFYFLEKFYSYAIFSSNNKQTVVDFRIYDYTKPNRIMKYELPNYIKKKLINFMKSFNLDTGSIDMIVDKSNNFIFLEVNPQGQFGGMEEYGLSIEKDIADYLIENDI